MIKTIQDLRYYLSEDKKVYAMSFPLYYFSLYTGWGGQKLIDF